jgi:hypothetical protein
MSFVVKISLILQFNQIFYQFMKEYDNLTHKKKQPELLFEELQINSLFPLFK